MEFVNPLKKDDNPETGVDGRSKIDSYKRANVSKRAMNKKLWVNTDKRCPICGHNKTLETNTYEKCAKCKYVIKR